MTTAALNLALQARLDLLQTLWALGDAAGIVAELYTEHTEITGAGNDALFQGPAALQALMTEMVEGSRGASIRIDRLRTLGECAAYTWVTWHVLPVQGEAFAMKSLFVWQLTEAGWRIVADMYAEGQINL